MCELSMTLKSLSCAQIVHISKLSLSDRLVSCLGPSSYINVFSWFLTQRWDLMMFAESV